MGERIKNQCQKRKMEKVWALCVEANSPFRTF